MGEERQEILMFLETAGPHPKSGGESRKSKNKNQHGCTSTAKYSAMFQDLNYWDFPTESFQCCHSNVLTIFQQCFANVPANFHQYSSNSTMLQQHSCNVPPKFCISSACPVSCICIMALSQLVLPTSSPDRFA